jgi:hypothetical protein
MIKKTIVSLIACAMLAIPASALAVDYADVLFIVDESGSMDTEHGWIGGMVLDLESALTAANVGDGANGNRYGLVGFTDYSGADGTPAGEFVRQIQVGGGQWGTAAELDAATSNFVLQGGDEDGYLAIDYALNNYSTRGGAGLNVIFITDEDREDWSDVDNINDVLASLNSRNAILNAAVDATYHSDNHTSGVIGIDGAGNAYVADGFGGFITDTGGIVFSDGGSTEEDYLDLAWPTGGAGWDLNILRDGGTDAESFTAAFIDIKVGEIQQQDPTNPVPVPAAVWLLGSGLMGLAGLRRRFKK